MWRSSETLSLYLCLVRLNPWGDPESGSVLLPRQSLLAGVFLPPFPRCRCRAVLSLHPPSPGWWLRGECISTFPFVSPFQLSGDGSHYTPLARPKTGGGGAASPRLQCISVWTAVAKPSFCSLEITLHNTKERSDLYINSRFSCHNISLFFFPKSVITRLCPATCCFTTNIILTQALWGKIIPLN